MPLIEIASDNSVSREQLRTFHLTGRGLDALAPQGPLHPALLVDLELPRFEQSYPIYFSDTQSPQPFFQLAGERIAKAFGQQIGSRACVSLTSVVDELPPEDREALPKTLPTDGWLIGFGESTPLLLTCAALQSARREARQSFVRQLKESGQRLRELLGVDDRKTEESTPENVALSLGARASSYLNTSALAEALRRRPNPTLPMEPERRARCESALAAIQDAIQDLKSLPSVILVHSGRAPEVPFAMGIQYEQASDACDLALTLCQNQLMRSIAVWKALRIAHLEIESGFDPSIHTEALDAFDSSMAHPEEIAALPVIVVFEGAERIEQRLASFARLLQSGLPVQVLIADRNAPRAHAGFHPLAYHDAFLLQSSIAATAHLIGGLSEMAATLRPSAALVAVSDSWSEASLLLLARAVPLWRYHPDLGESWFQRFALETPTPNEQLTFAQAAAVMPAYRTHFRVLPGGTETVALPFLSIVGDNRHERRAVFTRELANLSSAAATRWRLLAELAAPRVVKEADPDAGDRARLDGAKEAILRVISILKNGEQS